MDLNNVAIGIIPAYAGSTSGVKSSSSLSSDHPRIRGEHAWLASAAIPALGSSPHMRGAPARVVSDGGCRGIIPAYAGSTSARHDRARPATDHPRIRGEHISDGSTARMRGGIIPAYAGSTR